MDPFLDPDHYEYKFAWQARHSALRKRLGPHAAGRARHYVSLLRAMRRRLMSGHQPSLLDYPSFGRSHPRNFIHRRRFEQLKRAIDRRETHRAMLRRGYFGNLKDYYKSHAR